MKLENIKTSLILFEKLSKRSHYLGKGFSPNFTFNVSEFKRINPLMPGGNKTVTYT